MANQTFSLSDNTVSIVAANEGTLSGLKGDAKMVTEQVNATKLATYAELISAISGISLTKGNLPRTISKTVKDKLTTAGGCKDAVAKKYLENSVGAKREFGFGDNTTPTAVMAVFNDQGITSEAKLAKAVSGEAEKSAALILAEKVMGKWSNKKDEILLEQPRSGGYSTMYARRQRAVASRPNARPLGIGRIPVVRIKNIIKGTFQAAQSYVYDLLVRFDDKLADKYKKLKSLKHPWLIIPYFYLNLKW